MPYLIIFFLCIAILAWAWLDGVIESWRHASRVIKEARQIISEDQGDVR